MKTFNKNDKVLLFLVFLFLLPSGVFAATGFPMILFALPFMLVALIPIIKLEQAMYKSSLQMEAKPAFYASAMSNVAATVVAIPLSWGLLFILQLIITGKGPLNINETAGRLASVTLQSAWIYKHEGHLTWMIPAATIVILIPAYFIAGKIKLAILKKLVTVIDEKKVKKAVKKANKVSYAVVFTLLIVYLFIRIT